MPRELQLTQDPSYHSGKAQNFAKMERKFSHQKQGIDIKWWWINRGWKLKHGVSITKKWWCEISMGYENAAWYSSAPWITMRTAVLAHLTWALALWCILFLCSDRCLASSSVIWHLPGHGNQNWTINLWILPVQGRNIDRYLCGKNVKTAKLRHSK